MNVEKQTFPSWAVAQKPVEHWRPLAPHSPWALSLPIVGLLTHLFAAKYTVSVSFAVINCTVCLLFPPGAWWPAVPRYESTYPLCVSLWLKVGLLLLASSPSACVFFSSHPWPTFFSVSFLPTPSLWNWQAYLSILQGWVSLHCPSACLSDFPHSGLLLQAGAGLFPAGVPVWEQLLTYVVLYFLCPLAFLLLGAHWLPSHKWDSFPWDFTVCRNIYFFPCTYTPPSLLFFTIYFSGG